MNCELSTFVGVGGDQAGVWRLDPVAGSPVLALSTLPRGSVYALAISPARDLLVAGTKQGDIYAVDAADNNGEKDVWRFRWGASILGLAPLGNSRFAVSDLEGRCAVFEAGDPGSFPRVFREGAPVCSLVSSGEFLVGWSVNGELLIWNRSNLTFARTLDAEVPPRPWGWAKAMDHPGWGRIAFPLAGGRLLLLDPASGETACWQAHKQDFFAVIPLDEHLLTIGCDDACLKIWTDLDGHEDQSLPVRPGIISGTALPSQGESLLLLDRDGRALLHDLESQTLFTDQPVSDSPCRSVLGPSAIAITENRRQLKESEVERLAEEADRELQSSDIRGFDERLDRIRYLGYEKVARSLSAHKARVQEDLLQELSLRRSLISSQSEGGWSVSSLVLYLDLLSELGQFIEAEAVLKRALEFHPNNSQFEERLPAIQLWSSYVRTRDPLLVVAPVLSITQYIDAAGIVGNPFDLCIQMKSSRGTPCQGSRLFPEAFIEKWEKLRGYRAESRKSSIRTASIRIGHSPVIEPPQDAVIFGDPVECPGVGLAVLFIQAVYQTVLKPIIFFNPSNIGSCESHSDHNSLCHAALDAAKNGPRSKSWLGHLGKQVQKMSAEIINLVPSATRREGVLR